MKSSKKLVSILSACSVALCLTIGTMADPAVYDMTYTSGEGFSVSDDGMTVYTRIYPGDKIANTEVYLGADNLFSDIAEGASDVLDDGTPCWANNTGRVYAVTPYTVDTGEALTDDEGNPLLDDAGNPVSMTDTKYALDTVGGIVETAFGSSGTDAVDPNTGSSAKDTAYSPAWDQTYFYTDDSGIQQTVSASDIDAAAYPNGTAVYLTYDTPADPTLSFLRWSVYKVQGDGSLARVPDDQLGMLGIPELSGAGQLQADAVNAAGGRLYITVNGINDHLVFIPVFGAAEQPAAEPEVPGPEAAEPDGLSDEIPDEFPEELQQNDVTYDEAGQEPVVIDDNTDTLDAELNADEIGMQEAVPNIDIVSDTDSVPAMDQPEPVPDGHTYEVYVDYIDPEWNGPSTGYYMYTGGEFSAEVFTAQINPEGLVFDGWTTDDDTLIIDGADSTQAVLRFDPAAEMTENKVIHVAVSYVQPQTEAPAVQTEAPSVQTEAPVIQTEAPVVLTEAPAEEPELEVLTAQNAVIEEENVTDNGDGSASVAVQQGDTVTVTANAAPEGQVFEQWSVVTDGTVDVSDLNSTTIEVTMNDADVLVEPVYMEAQNEPEDQPADGQKSEEPADQPADGQKSEEPADGQKSEEPADQPADGGKSEEPADQPADGQKSEEPADQPADGEKSEEPADQPADGQKSEEPADQPADSQKTEEPADQPIEGQDDKKEEKPAEYTLTVVSGSADKTVLQEGATAVVTANPPSAGYQFSSWTVSGSGSLANAASTKTTFTMGAGNATVTANYVKISYTLTVKNGTGSGSHTSGEKVLITADYPASGKEFDSWVVTKGSVSIDDVYDYFAEVTMPASDAAVKATYKNGPDPNNNAITGLENNKEYLKGTTLSFTAVGAGMEKEGRNPGDYRYKPSGYLIGGVTGSWSSSPYTTSMAINAAGDYTLTVTFMKEIYDGSDWNTEGTTVTKSITFHVVSAMSVNTGDSTPLLPLAIAGIAALAIIIALIVVLVRRKR